MPTRLALLLALALPLTASASAAEPVRIADVPEFEGLAERWAAGMKNMGLPGLAVAVVKDGQVIALDAFGVRNPAGDPVTPDTIFYIASCTKTYVAADLAMLAAAGAVDLDRPVLSYLPRFRLADAEATESITVRDLLCHRPGLDSGPIVFLDAYTGEITEDRYYHFLAEATPTGSVEYSNLHFTLAGRVIEAVTGRSWKDDLDARLFDPAGMHRTTAYASTMYGDPNAAIPMERSGDRYIACRTRKGDNVMHAAGGLGTTARDGARWIQLQLGDGMIGDERVLSEATARQLRTRQSDSTPSGRIRRLDGFGLGWMLGTYRDRPYATHGGGYVGTAAHLSFLPEAGIGIVALANASPAGQGMVTIVSIDVYDRLLDERDHEDLLPKYEQRIAAFEARANEAGGAQPIEPGALALPVAAYAGRYADEHWGTLTIEVEDDALRGRIGDLAVEFVAGEGDALTLRSPGTGDVFEARFILEDDRVVGVLCEDETDRVQFDRE